MLSTQHWARSGKNKHIITRDAEASLKHNLSARTKAIQKAATRKQQSLIAELEKGEIPSRAVQNAGYSKSNIHNALQSKAVQKALASIEANTRDLTSLTREDVIEGLLSAIQMAESLDDPATMIRGWNEIARLHGFHAAEKKEISMKGEVTHDHSGQVQLEQMPTSELLKLSSKDSPIDIGPEDYEVSEWRGSEEGELSSSSEDLFDPTEDGEDSG